MYWTGFTQGMMWRQFDQSGMLLYPNFLETVTQLMPMYLLRSLGGLVHLLGVVFMIVNLWKTAKSGKLVRSETYQAPAITKKYKAHAGEGKLRFLERMPLTFHITVLGCCISWWTCRNGSIIYNKIKCSNHCICFYLHSARASRT